MAMMMMMMIIMIMLMIVKVVEVWLVCYEVVMVLRMSSIDDISSGLLYFAFGAQCIPRG